jgi:mannose-6-phosphate isomerase-like protein (cupin superfamily)
MFVISAIHHWSFEGGSPMRRSISTLLLAVAIGVALLAQGSSGPPAAYPAGPPAAPSIYKSWADVNAELSKGNPNSLTGVSMSVSRLAGNVGVRRRGAGSPQFAIIHPRTMEIYQIVDGTATYVTGGTLTPPLTDNGPDIYRSMAITGGTSRKVGKDDIIVTPPGTPHWFSQIDGAITYMEVTFEMPTK